MILGKFWSAFRAQLNKIANLFWEADPIAQMRYEYDQALEQLKEGRKGLELYRGLVERVNRQVAENQAQCQRLEAQAKSYLKAGERDTAARFALELQKARKELAEKEATVAELSTRPQDVAPEPTADEAFRSQRSNGCALRAGPCGPRCGQFLAIRPLRAPADSVFLPRRWAAPDRAGHGAVRGRGRPPLPFPHPRLLPLYRRRGLNCCTRRCSRRSAARPRAGSRRSGRRARCARASTS